MEFGSNIFQFKFHTEFDMERVLKGGPWSFDNQALMLRRWQKGMMAKKCEIWVRFFMGPNLGGPIWHGVSQGGGGGGEETGGCRGSWEEAQAGTLEPLYEG